MLMNHCIQCGSACTDGNRCLQCGYEPTLVSGFLSFAPEMARNASGFDPLLHRQLADLQSRNFWFRARNLLIVFALRKFAPTMRSFLEVGCGTGFVLSAIRNAFPALHAAGSELFIEGLDHASQQLPDIDFIQMDARRIPFSSKFDAIGAFDVLEHIEDDAAVLGEIHRALLPQGLLLLTVPQHQWLWSAQDEYAHHVRRYCLDDIQSKLATAGFHTIWRTSFVTLLLPVMLVSRLGDKSRANADPFREFRIPRWLDGLLYGVMRIELALVKCGLRMPVGGSLMIVAKKVPQ